MARAARRLASSVSCLFFSLSSSLAATSVVGAVSPDLGVSSSSRLAAAASRGVSSAICRLKSDAERVVPGLERLQIGVGEVLVPQRRFGRGEGRARLVEIERMGVLRPGAPGPQEDQGENGPENGPKNGPVQLAQGGRRLHRRQNGPEADSAARSLIHPTMAGPPRQLAPSTVLRTVHSPRAEAQWEESARRRRFHPPTRGGGGEPRRGRRQDCVHSAPGKGLRARSRLC